MDKPEDGQLVETSDGKMWEYDAQTSGWNEVIETRIVDLTRIPFGSIRAMNLKSSVTDLLTQVRRRRVNLGGGGPPGRAD